MLCLVCSILETRDKAGRGIRYVRDDRGRLLQMQGETQKIAFHYDAQSRIDHAEDSAGHTVDYSYDEHGRLRRVRGADGTLRRYDYTDRGEMAEIEEPAFTIENWYGRDASCGSGSPIHPQKSRTSSGSPTRCFNMIGLEGKTRYALSILAFVERIEPLRRSFLNCGRLCVVRGVELIHGPSLERDGDSPT